MKKVLAFTLAIMMFLVVIPSSAASFTDIESGHWAYSAINELVAKGTIGGYTDGSFRPNNTVTRAEFVKMVGEGSVKRKNDYADVPPQHWAYKYVITSGFASDSDNKFNPDKAITRAQTVKILYERFGKSGVVAPAFVEKEADYYAIDKDALSWIYTYGVLVGDNGIDLRLGDTLTRAEAAALIVKCSKAKLAKKASDIISDVVLENYANGTGIFADGYSPNKTVTNAELAAAAVRFANNTDDVDYSKYVITDEIDHKYSKDLFIMCNSNIGTNNFNVKFANAVATADTAEKAVKNAAERVASVKIDKTVLLYPDGNKTATVTQKDVVALMVQYDVIYGSQYAYTTDMVGDNYTKINTSVETDGKRYPAASKKFAVILKDIPKEVYNYPLTTGSGTSGTPAELHSFAREYASMFTAKCANYVLAADKGFGVKMRITFYPSLAYNNGSGFAFRVKVTALNTTDYTPYDLFGEKVITKKDTKLTKGTEFFAEIAVESII